MLHGATIGLAAAGRLQRGGRSVAATFEVGVPAACGPDAPAADDVAELGRVPAHPPRRGERLERLERDGSGRGHRAVQ